MRPGKRGARQAGFTLLAVLAALVLLALGTERVMTLVSTQVQREREAELVRIGTAYADAIRDFHQSTPGSVKRWPRELKDLVDDRRFVTVRRHLREVYPDPVTRSADWGVIRAPDGGIAGVYSLSDKAPLRTTAFESGGLVLDAASRYSDWQFAHPVAASR